MKKQPYAVVNFNFFFTALGNSSGLVKYLLENSLNYCVKNPLSIRMHEFSNLIENESKMNLYYIKIRHLQYLCPGYIKYFSIFNYIILLR